MLPQSPKDPSKQRACRIAKSLNSWAKQDAKAALAYSGAGFGAAILGLEPVAGVLEGAAAVREGAAVIESGIAGALTYYAKGNFVPFAGTAMAYGLGRAAGSGFGSKPPAIRGPALGIAGLRSDAAVDAAGGDQCD